MNQNTVPKPTPDINQRDDANEIKTVIRGGLVRFLLRRLRPYILLLIERRLSREQRIGRISNDQRYLLVNTFRRTFNEDTDA